MFSFSTDAAGFLHVIDLDGPKPLELIVNSLIPAKARRVLRDYLIAGYCSLRYSATYYNSFAAQNTLQKLVPMMPNFTGPYRSESKLILWIRSNAPDGMTLAQFIWRVSIDGNRWESYSLSEHPPASGECRSASYQAAFKRMLEAGQTLVRQLEKNESRVDAVLREAYWAMTRDSKEFRDDA